jgi:phage/conjugal plasmid C-4 type zinc finger TraR family protein
MDKADIAQELIEWKLEQVMNARHRSDAPVLESRSACKECEEAIPAARQEALPGVQFCVACQSAMEGR